MDQVFSGNDVRVEINGIDVELVQTLRLSAGWGHEPVSGIGEYDPRGHVPTAPRYTANFTKMAMPKEQAIRAGIIYKNSDVALEGKTFDVSVFKKDGPLIRKITGCVNDGGDLNVTAHRIIMTDAVFLGRAIDGDIATQ